MAPVVTLTANSVKGESPRAAAKSSRCRRATRPGSRSVCPATAASTRRAPVAASTIAIAGSEPRTCRSTAIHRPSGDHRGAANSVSWVDTSAAGVDSDGRGVRVSAAMASSRRSLALDRECYPPAVGREVRVGRPQAGREAGQSLRDRSPARRGHARRRHSRRGRPDRTPAGRRSPTCARPGTVPRSAGARRRRARAPSARESRRD